MSSLDDLDQADRRTFLKLMGASLALGGFTACTRQPAEAIVPYVRQPEDLVLGVPLYFATAMPIGGSAAGLIVESHEGRPTKIEGNPSHPASLGAADVFAQAAILSLYDPDRAQTITHLGEIQSWAEFLGAMRAAVAAQQPLKGAGLRILTESVSSPTLAAQLRDLLKRFPSAKWHQWDPLSRDNAKHGARLAFGRYADTTYHLDRADVIVSLDADFLHEGPAGLRYTRDFSARRRPDGSAKALAERKVSAERMNRLYVVEGMPTVTGGRADHRLPRRPGMIPGLAEHLAAAVGAGGSTSSSLDPRATKWVTAVAKDLRAHRGGSVVIAGDTQPPEVHALAHAINAALGNTGRTVVYTEPVEAEPVDHLESLRDLVADMRAGKVDVLLIAGGNPVYSAPIDIGFADALAKVNLRAHLSLHVDETSAQCHWQIPEAHFLESWSDARSFDGTASIVQPLIAPLYNGKTAHEFLAATTDQPEQSPYEIVRAYWKTQSHAQDFEADWRRWLHDGVIPNTAFAPVNLEARRAGFSTATQNARAFEINFRLDPSVADGRFANNGWLQELPKPVTKLTWDNAVLVSPTTAQKLGAENNAAKTAGEHGQILSDAVELKYRGRTVRGLLFAVPGHPDDCATVHLGYGRERGGQIAHGAGFNAYVLRTSDALWQGDGLEIVKTGAQGSLACTQFHHQMEGRRPVRATTREEFVKDPRASVHEGDETPPKIITLYPDFKYEGYKWGMAIDVNACTGCNACIVSCQAENNIPVVGKDQVLRGREMHWLRVDEYHEGPPETPEMHFQPVPCMHCENAPCEEVCPVGATVHSDEGLNDMVYNRCVGTRYCSNNCPYKVRRFNFLLYQDWNTPSLQLARNPDVSIRSRGVMEKCTYCVQRINRAKIESEKDDRRVQDGEIKTACQQTCPADAIVFGDLNDPSSRVAKLQAEARNYSLLGELNTRPRTTYLAAVRNPNPELEGL